MEEESKSDEKGKSPHSLVVITNMFLNYMQTHKDKVVDLSEVERELDVSKRRLYDVTNVLVGVGIIERTGKSKVKWVDEKAIDKEHLKPSMDQLLEKEKGIDDQLREISKATSNLLNLPEFNQNGYLTLSEIQNIANPPPNSAPFILTGPKDFELVIKKEGEYVNFVGSSQTGPVNLVSLNDNK